MSTQLTLTDYGLHELDVLLGEMEAAGATLTLGNAKTMTVRVTPNGYLAEHPEHREVIAKHKNRILVRLICERVMGECYPLLDDATCSYLSTVARDLVLRTLEAEGVIYALQRKEVVTEEDLRKAWAAMADWKRALVTAHNGAHPEDVQL